MVNLLDVATTDAKCEDVVVSNAGLLTVLDYLRSKESLEKFDKQEELIFYPEVSTAA